ncbi:4a-hydroxytetrahydrobiopterin dehydratase [Massilia agilis]|uniref:Putative pterin-4-alpha-carbinolamine dehydratase n=1 Tax=Massilia agilis TaxID=1811226 RepID=A0ABT2DDC1_9BURK|nr:4a-hydroxytetrahydrobiopterin dehydratase [Massilia agilis]MCS0808431.1 4a-hydroxytetrahydrobiopterin dehydratase [Massilia agilis]
MSLTDKRCAHGAQALEQAAIDALLPQVPGWAVQGNQLVRSFEFNDYHQTIEFVNALAWMIHAQDHHPELTVRYRHCIVAYSTHTAGNNISENDFICAARANRIYDERATA